MKNFNNETYNNILNKIYEAATEGKFSTSIVSNNSNSEFWYPYERQLRVDGFIVTHYHNSEGGITLSISWISNKRRNLRYE